MLFRSAFVQDLDEVLLTPMREAEGLFSKHAYLTRLTSSVSPEEMTLDPVFTQNAQMGDVSNVHRATLVYECGNGTPYDEAPRFIELSDGRILRLPPESVVAASGQTDSAFLADLGERAAEVVQETSGGAPVVVTDARDTIDGQIDDHNRGVADSETDGCACEGIVPTSPTMLGFAIGLMGLLRAHRRRARPTPHA